MQVRHRVRVEHSGIINLGGVLFPYKGLSETDIHERIGESEENRHHGDESVVVRCEKTGKQNGDKYTYPPSTELLEEGPEYTGGGLGLEIL